MAEMGPCVWAFVLLPLLGGGVVVDGQAVNKTAIEQAAIKRNRFKVSKWCFFMASKVEQAAKLPVGLKWDGYLKGIESFTPTPAPSYVDTSAAWLYHTVESTFKPFLNVLP